MDLQYLPEHVFGVFFGFFWFVFLKIIAVAHISKSDNLNYVGKVL